MLNECEALMEMKSTIGYAPDTLVISDTWTRFNTNSKNAGSYIAHEFIHDARSFYIVLYLNFASNQIVHTWKSWGVQEVFTKQEKEELEKQLKEKEYQAKKKLLEQYQELATKAETICRGHSFELKGNGYLVRKKIEDVQLSYKHRTDSSPYRARVDHTENLLYIPLQDEENKIWSYQTIAKNGFKSFCPGARKKGCFHLIGKLDSDDQIVYVCEGYATGASIYLATQQAVFVCFDAGNLKFAINNIKSLARSVAPNALILVCGDDDRFTDKPHNPGKTMAMQACENIIGATWTVPEFKRPDKPNTDFNDLHVEESLEEVAYQLNPEIYIYRLKNEWFESHGKIWSIKTKDEPGYSLDPEQMSKVANFSIQKQFELYDEETKEITRYVKIKQKNDEVNELVFKASTVRSDAEFETWLYSKAVDLVTYKTFSVKGLKRYLDRLTVPRITIKQNFGKQTSGEWLFRNCLIDGKNIIQPGKFDSFILGRDKSGREIGIKLKETLLQFTPILDLKTNDKDIKLIIAELINVIKQSYGLNGLMALGFAVSTLFMNDIGKATGSMQFPTLSLYGEPMSGKSSLLKLLEHLHGFSPDKKLYSGVSSNSTLPQLEGSLMRSNNLLVCLTEIKPHDREKIEQLIQTKYDGHLRQKSHRDPVSKEWVSKYRESGSAMACDSNHLFQMESVIDRLVPLEFKKENFNLSVLKKFNPKLKQLSSITRLVILNQSPSKLCDEVLATNEHLINKELINTRQALGISICLAGLNVLFRLSDEKCWEDLKIEMSEWVTETYKTTIEEYSKGTNLFHEFMEWYLSTFTRNTNIKEKGIAIPAEKTVIVIKKLSTNELIVPLKTLTIGIDEFATTRRLVRSDIKKAIQSSSMLKDWNFPYRIMGRVTKAISFNLEEIEKVFEIPDIADLELSAVLEKV